MARLLARLSAAWRAIWTPKAVRDIEDAGLDPARSLPAPRPDAEPRQGVDAMRERLDAIEQRNRDIAQRNRELARLYARRREES